jgi:hypothetical protein
MIQIEDWMIIVGLLFAFILFIAYLLYFRVSRKLFPETIKFEKQIDPYKGSIVCEIKGAGIVKTIELKTNRNCILDITIDGTNHTLLNIGSQADDHNKSSFDYLTIKEQLNQKFTSNFSIHIQNQSNQILECNGLTSYELKKKLGVTLKTVFTE